MPDDFSLLASQGNNLCFINDRVLILGREVCVVFYPVKVVFEFQNNIFASLNAIFESFVHIRTIKKIDDINPVSYTHLVEGTNSAGDLGAAASVSFQNRNLFRGSETFMIKFRGAYEVISGLQAGYSNNNYTEYGVETSINFPNFLFPFLSSDYKRKIRATTEFGLQYNYQMRPEFLRTMASASWSYKWTQRQKIQHRIDLINIGFLYLPRISEKFKNDFINKGQSHILQYNYQDRLIINMGYSYHYNSIGCLLYTSNLD